MLIKNIFQKDVSRPIEGVIKADDEKSLRTEIEEYVLTNEIAKRLEGFLEVYLDYRNINGVWVSGFFGSGKSHLLKLLALLLENRDIEGTPTLDLFINKCGDNEILKGDLKKAVTIPSKSILFNIDQKADVISKTQIDALLAVFVKVFDEMCGYYGKQGYIAQFERDLDSRKLLETFKSKFKELSGLDWTKGREQSLLETKNIARAYNEVTNNGEENSKGILDKYRKEFKVSIEDFAEKIHDYIETQEPNFRLNFLVDEVGQYIADNTKLMTNLQTISESLATKCRGRAWIIVTAQEDMNSVVGEMGKKQGNDFTKIQARFDTRMKLTSADVAEVIQKRLLHKNDESLDPLQEIYKTQVNNFKTLFNFVDGSQTYKNFNDEEHFINCYPFIPYQFTLFQKALQNLSIHNAFEGKHSAVGERSMLGVFQQVALNIVDQDVNNVATFDLMFEGIRTSLKAQIQQSVIVAEKHLDNQLAVRVLKALFLVKYIKEFKATVTNIRILMLDQFERDLPSLRKKIEEALNLLEQQTYIQRNGDCYEYLTNEEKDIEQEIKNTDIELSEIPDEIAKLAFDYVVKTKKIRHSENGYDYSFSRKLDDSLIGREHELSIHILSPQFDGNGEIYLRTTPDLLVVMPPDARFVNDLLMFKRTEKYIKQNTLSSQTETVRRIISDKTVLNSERYQNIQKDITTLLSKAKIMVYGVEKEISSENPQLKISTGFCELVNQTYPNLKMLRGVKYSIDQIESYLNAESTLFNNEEMISEAEQEVFNFIKRNKTNGIRTTVKSLIDHFEVKPYGWPIDATLCNLAKLHARGKVECKEDSNILEAVKLAQILSNTHKRSSLIIEPQIDFTSAQVRQLKDFFGDFFDKPAHQNEAKALGEETKDFFAKLGLELADLNTKVYQYKFLKNLEELTGMVDSMANKQYTYFLTDLKAITEKLLEIKETILDPIHQFMKGPQKELYHKADVFLKSHDLNFNYIDTTEKQEIEKILNDPNCYKGNRMKQVKDLMENLQSEVNEQLKTEKTQAIDKINTLSNRVNSMNEYSRLDNSVKADIKTSFDSAITNIEQQNLIDTIRSRTSSFEESEYRKILAKLDNHSKKAPANPQNETNSETSQEKTKPAKIEMVSKDSLDVQYSKAWIADESDADKYVDAFKKAIIVEIKKGKKVQI